MKKLLICLAFILGVTIYAQVPMGFKYQAIARDAFGNISVNKNVSIKISIILGNSPGSLKYSETYNLKTNEFGLINLVIGERDPSSFGVIDWNAGEYWLSVELDGILMGSSQILSVPYALYSKTAENIAGGIIEKQNLADVIAINNSAKSQIKDVITPTDDHDAVTKAYVDVLLKELEYLKSISGIDTVSDKDGNSYKTIKIGTQKWMAENLKTTKYNDGTEIQLVSDSANWGKLSVPGYCWYQNNENEYKNPYGALYNCYAVKTGKLCPSGWWIPSTEEWTTMIDYLGGESIAGIKLKEKGTIHWENSNNVTNESGFTAVATMIRTREGEFAGSGKWNGIWYTSNMNLDRPYIVIVNIGNNIGVFEGYNQEGLSVRCMKDSN